VVRRRANFFAGHYEAWARDSAEIWNMADLFARFYICSHNGSEALWWVRRALDVADANDLWRYQVRGSVHKPVNSRQGQSCTRVHHCRFGARARTRRRSTAWVPSWGIWG